MTQDDHTILFARLLDLAESAEKGKGTGFSRFLDPTQQSYIKSRRFLQPVLWGGYEDAQRKIAGFFPCYEEPSYEAFPICAVLLSTAENLDHRTVLGALMGLGIERNLIGDIVMTDEGPVVYCLMSMGQYICLNLKQAGRHKVTCREIPVDEVKHRPPTFVLKRGTVASLRLDCVIGFFAGLSRSGAEEVIKKDMVFVNHMVSSKTTLLLKVGDTISLRGFGKCELMEVQGETKKGRIRIVLKQYT